MAQAIAIPIRVGSQSRVFAISQTGRTKLLDDLVLRKGNQGNGTRTILTALYMPSGVRAYHMHEVGRSWVPTAPTPIGGTGSVRIRTLSPPDFVSHLPMVVLDNVLLKRWFPEQTRVSGYDLDGRKLTMNLIQTPEIEGVRSFEIQSELVRPLSFLDGDVFLEIAMHDYFGFGRRLRVYHDGHSGAWLGLQHSARFDKVHSIASDGVRERFLYRSNRSGMQTATIYVRNPANLFSIVKTSDDTQTRLVVRMSRPDYAIGVSPLRNLEWMMLNYGSTYDHARIGAEVAYSIASKVLDINRLAISEPALGGADLVSRDGRFAVEARMLTGARFRQVGSIVDETLRHMRQMIRKARWELSAHSYERCFAVLTLQLGSRDLLTLVREG